MPEDDILIPTERIQDGLDLCLQQIVELVNSAKGLYDAKHYATSVALSILATEELAKVRLLLERRDKKKDITRREWRDITFGRKSHKLKLTYEYVNAREFLLREVPEDKYRAMMPVFGIVGGQRQMPYYEELVKSHPEDIRRLEALDVLKQDALYVDWNGSEWNHFLKRMSKHRQKAIAMVEVNRAICIYWMMARWNQFPGVFNAWEMRQHITNIEALKARMRIESKGYKDKAKVWRSSMPAYVELLQKREEARAKR